MKEGVILKNQEYVRRIRKVLRILTFYKIAADSDTETE